MYIKTSVIATVVILLLSGCGLKSTVITAAEFVGQWQAGNSIGSGYSKRYAFYDDGTFQWAESQMLGGARLIWLRGFWEYADNTITLTITDEYRIVGGELVPDVIRADGVEIVGGELSHVRGLDYKISYNVTKPEYKNIDDAYKQMSFNLGSDALYDYTNQSDFFDAYFLYEEYLFELNPQLAEMDSLFFEYGDIDHDSHTEVIAAYGKADSDWLDSIYESYILRVKNGKPEVISLGFANGAGYEAYKIELVRFAGENDSFIVIGVTNYANLMGIRILKLDGSELIELAYDASATGSGYAWLTEKNQGMYEGYYSVRRSYDVLYYPVTSYYTYEDGAFACTYTTVDVGDYPDNPENVVDQFMSLCLLSEWYDSDDIALRLDEICGGNDAIMGVVCDNDMNTLYEAALYGDMFGTGGSLSVESEINGIYASITINCYDDENAAFFIVFELECVYGMWRIAALKIANNMYIGGVYL